MNNEQQYNFKVAEPRGYGEFISSSQMNDLVQKQVEIEEKGYITVSRILLIIYIYFYYL